jgi:hypoxia up-regulated 1
MVLRFAKKLADIQAKETIKDCVITIPPFFTMQQRQALLDAASIHQSK